MPVTRGMRWSLSSRATGSLRSFSLRSASSAASGEAERTMRYALP